MIRPLLSKLKDAPVIYVRAADLANSHQFDKSDFSPSGDWDKLGNNITTGKIYKAFKQRLRGKYWESTKLYNIKHKLGERWLKKLPIWDSMLQDIVSNGYTQRNNKDKVDEYISCLIGRNGHFFIYNGIHRLVCCLLSQKVGEIPVKVLLRHTEWDKFKNACINYQKTRGKLYCQLPHPDLKDIPYYWNNDRAELAARNSFYKGGSVVDLGSHWGTSSYIFAQKGHKVTAIERSLKHFKYLRKISKLPGKPFKVKLSDFTKLTLNIETLLLFNIAHHFIIDKKKQRSFIDFLKRTNCKEVFYQSHKHGDKWSPYMSPDEMLELITENLNMSRAISIKNFNERNLWHLVR